VRLNCKTDSVFLLVAPETRQLLLKSSRGNKGERMELGMITSDGFSNVGGGLVSLEGLCHFGPK